MTLLETLDGLKEELRVDLTFRTWQRVANEVDRLYDTPGAQTVGEAEAFYELGEFISMAEGAVRTNDIMRQR